MDERKAEVLPPDRDDGGPGGTEGTMPHSDEAERLEELRTLLREPDWDKLIELHNRLDDPARYAEEVGRVLPSAVVSSRQRDQRLDQSLSPLVEHSFRDTVRRDPQTFADAIFPVIGPAIRKSIANALAGIVQSINQGLNNTFTPRGLRWRWEAIRTGKSFGEIALLHSLVYRVEQVFLIHKETGLLLEHAVAEDVEAQPPEMVAAMLTAIQDYLKDSFQATQRGGAPDAMRWGDVGVWVEDGPEAILAAVIRGVAPAALREDFQAALEDIHTTHREPLESFDGDASAFVTAKPRLEECLRLKLTERAPKPPWFALALMATVLLLLAWWFVPRTIESRRWRAYQVRIQDEPGIVVTQLGRRDGKWYVAGLRDPLAPDPRTFLDAAGIDSNAVESRWDPFVSLLPDLILRRAHATLAPPGGVDLSLRDGVLVATGSVPTSWLERARSTALTIPGVRGFEVEDQVLSDLVAGIQGQTLLFPLGSDRPVDPAEVEEVARQVRALDLAARARGRRVTLEVLGSTDDRGDSLFNARLAVARAERVRALLVRAGIGQTEVRGRAAPFMPPADTSEAVRARFRRASFSVTLTRREESP